MVPTDYATVCRKALDRTSQMSQRDSSHKLETQPGVLEARSSEEMPVCRRGLVLGRG